MPRPHEQHHGQPRQTCTVPASDLCVRAVLRTGNTADQPVFDGIIATMDVDKRKRRIDSILVAADLHNSLRLRPRTGVLTHAWGR